MRVNVGSFVGIGEMSAASTIETLERELGGIQDEKERRQRATLRAENAHEAACAARDEAWEESASDDPEVQELSTLVRARRRQLYEAIDRLKATEGRERRVKSRLMYVLPAERRRYLSGKVDEEFEEMIAAIRAAHARELPDVEIQVVTEEPGRMDLRGDATWRALERLHSETTRRWLEVRAGRESPALGRLIRYLSHYAGSHVPRVFVAGEEVHPGPLSDDFEEWPELSGYDTQEGRIALARITARRYLDEESVARLGKRPRVLVELAGIARLYQSLSLTREEIHWRLEQLVPLRLETLEAVSRLTRERRRFSFYEIARAARLLDAHFPDSSVAADALLRSIDRALESGVPLVDVAYMNVSEYE